MTTHAHEFFADWTFLVPLAASFIALAGVLIGLRIQNRNFQKQIQSSHALKIAEMRQSWIYDMRDAMAKAQSYGVTPDLNHVGTREFYEYGTKIELFMNPNDEDYQKLQDCLYRFLSARNQDEKYSANPKYIEICQKILKREWDRLKRELESIK